MGEVGGAPQAGTKRRLALGTTSANILVLIVAAAIVLVAVYFATGLKKGGSATEAGPATAAGAVTEVDLVDSSSPPPEVGALAPNFTATTLPGDRFSLSEQKGGPVWLVFNATWCADCRAEIPDIEKMQQQFGDQVKIVSIYLSDTVSQVASYSDTLSLTYTQIPDPTSEIGALYRVMGVPSHVFIGEDGTVQQILVGSLSEKAMTEHLEQLLQ